MQWRVFVLIVFSSLLAACGGGQTEVPPIEAKINVQTRVSDSNSRAVQTKTEIDNPICLTPTQDTTARPKCQFTLSFASSTPFLAGLQPGNLLVSEPSSVAPNGYLVKVSSVSAQGAGLIIKGEEAQIGDAVDQGEASFEQPLTINNLKAAQVLRPSVHFGKIGKLDNAFNLNFDEIVYDQDSNPSTTNDQVRVSGSFNFASFDGFSAGVKWKKVLGVPVYPKGIYFRAALGFKQNASITVKANLNKAVEKTIDLAKYTFNPITVFVGPVPLVFVPTVRVAVSAKGEASAALEYTASEQFNAVAGVEYDGGFHNISELTPIDQVFSQSVGVAGAAVNIRGGLDANSEILLYGLVGPYAKVTGYLNFDAAIPRDPFWVLTGGVSANVGLHADLYYKTLDYDAPLFDKSFKLAQSENQSPSVKITTPTNGIKVQLNQGLFGGLCAEGKDLEDGDLAKQVTGAINATIPKGSSCVQIPGNSSVMTSEGVKTFTVTVSDSKGKTAQASTSITVENSPPNAFVVKPKASDVIYSGQKVLLQGYAVDGNETIDCSSVKANNPKIVFSSSNPNDTMPANACPTSSAVATFNGAGNHTLTLTATDTQGKQSTSTLILNVQAAPVNANYPPDIAILEPEVKDPANPPSYGGTNENIALTGRVFDQESALVSYRWLYKATPSSSAVQFASGNTSAANGTSGETVNAVFNTSVLPKKCNGLSGGPFVILLEVTAPGNAAITIERTFNTISGIC